jgi:hypothetical protein
MDGMKQKKCPEKNEKLSVERLSRLCDKVPY